MGFKTILVHCDAAPEAGRRFRLAAAMAQRHAAHLVGVHARPPLQVSAFFEGGVAMDALFASYDAGLKAEAATARAGFESALRGHQLSHEWRTADGYIESVLAGHARYADLLVVGQASPEDATSSPGDLPEAVALSAGRPCLVVPRGGAERLPGTNVLLCWNASRESARAAADALPLLRDAKTVTILVVDPRSSPDGHGAEPGADVATWLARHGVQVTVQREVAADNDVGHVILSRASDLDADLIVMGLYGHGRLREMILGGASRAVLAGTTVPLFVSH
jgi:nucleotide-binding universal stress UspA family protein